MLLDEGYEELARRSDLDGTDWTPDDEVQRLLDGRAVFHWFLLAELPGGLVKGPIEAVSRP